MPESHLADRALSAVLVRDFNKFTFENWNEARTTRITPARAQFLLSSRSPAMTARANRSPMPADRDSTPCPVCRLHTWLCLCAQARGS